jgi:dihydroorotate dehydrogenase
MGTAVFVDPVLPGKLVRGLNDWVARQGCSTIAELVGAVKV